ncbi:MAG: hypothetical protein H8E64_02170 [Candidatus Marinimicrobia bacterium]|nr:hypothetical protein [Candidatus Neomarinimicrobiota bacterium]
MILTPFNHSNKIDWHGLGSLIQWYLKADIGGLFAVCGSSEINFFPLQKKKGCLWLNTSFKRL